MRVDVIQVSPQPHAAVVENAKEIKDIKADIEKFKQEQLDTSLLLILLEQRIETLERKEAPG